MNTEFEPDSPELQKLLLLDSLATRYHLLPSVVLQGADTLDILVMDASISYHRYIDAKEQAKQSGGAPPVPDVPLEKLQAMMRATKNEI